jgi:hypothetical protein
MNDNPYAAPQTDPGTPEISLAISKRVPRWLRFLVFAWLIQCALALAIFLFFLLVG